MADVTRDTLRPRPRVHALMIEVNRSLYLDEATGERLVAFGEVKARLLGALGRIVEGWAAHVP